MTNIRKHSKFIFHKPIIQLLAVTMLISYLLTGCKKDAAPEQAKLDAQAQTLDQLTAKWGLPNIVVHNGESIQAAVNKAKKGWIIFIEPGTYSEAIVVSKPGIKLIGEFSLWGNGVVIKNPGDEEDGIAVTDKGDGFVLANVTVKNFEENGVYLDSVDNFIISFVTAINDGEYGIFPVHSNHGVVEFCVVTGCSDTGIYVGQSSDVKMQFNKVYGNVNGLEIENSSYVTAENNNSYNNVCGLLIDLLPGKDIKTSANILVSNNHIHDNNHINFGEPGSLESVVPTGLGILVLGTDATTIENNKITGNGFAGVAVFSTLILASLAGIPPGDILADIEPYPDGDKIRNNTLKNNGFNPPAALGLPGVDLLYDGSGTNNCWSNNTFTTSFNLGTLSPQLPSCN